MEKEKTIQHLIDKEWCKGCGICIHFCPKNVLEFDENGKAEAVRPKDCIACKLCELRCPDLAIQIVDGKADQTAQTLEEEGNK